MSKVVRRALQVFAVIAALVAVSASAASAAEDGAAEKDGKYIVVFKDSVDQPASLAREQVDSKVGELGFIYRHALEGYSAELSDQAVKELAADPSVAYVEEDARGGIAAQTTPTGISRTFAATNKALSINEKDDLRANVDVAVIDTGIDNTHPDLNVVTRTDCSNGATKAGECKNESGTDGNGHGTHVAGTIGAIDNGSGVVGVAPGARLWAVKVLDSGGSGELSEYIAGIDWVTGHASEIEVANASLRYFTTSSTAFSEAMKASIAAGVVHVVAAGNENEAVKYIPGNYPDVITVSAIADYDGKSGAKGSPTCENYGADDSKATFSNYGATVDIAAPGVCVYSTWAGGGYAYDSGTSMASPHVAGAAAVLAALKNPGSKAEVEAIRNTLVAAGNSGWTDTSGDGVKEPLLDLSNEKTFLLSTLQPPAITTKAATGITETSAELGGAVNPNGSETKIYFEYGTTVSYGSKSIEVSVGSGTTILEGSLPVSGLAPNTTYHYRFVGTNANGTATGVDQVFSTISKPSVETKAASGIGETGATLKGTVNPNGAETKYHFEYGTSTSYGTNTAEVSAGAGTTTLEVSKAIAGLLPGGIYHFRIVATNAGGTTNGKDQTFTTTGVGWAVQATSTAARLRSVSCTSSSACIAVGDIESKAVSEKWNGTEWSPLSIPSAGTSINEVNSVSCSSSTACIAVGLYWSAGTRHVLVEIWNGTEWKLQTAPEPPGAKQTVFQGVSCSSASACTAVGYYESSAGKNLTLKERWNGTEWKVQESSTEGFLHSVSCSSATACMAVGNVLASTLVESWNGTEWKLVATPASPIWLEGVSCTASNACIAVGAVGPFEKPAAETWNGTSWTLQSTPNPAGAARSLFQDVSCNPSASACTAVGWSESTSGVVNGFVERWNGTSWAIQLTPFPAESTFTDFWGVSCTSSSVCKLVGRSSLGSLAERYQ